MPYTIVIDAGHGGSDPGAVYEGRREKDDNLSLAIAVGELLSQQGVSVIYTRTTDVYQTPFEKAQMANQADADFFISFHRNSSEEPNQYTGVKRLSMTTPASNRQWQKTLTARSRSWDSGISVSRHGQGLLFCGGRKCRLF